MDVLRLFLPAAGLLIAGPVVSNVVIQANGPFWLAVLLGVVPLLTAMALLQRAKRRQAGR